MADTPYTAVLALRAKHVRVFGRVWCRYTCGTCGSQSWWHRPYQASQWVMHHCTKSPTCYRKEQ